MSYEEYIAKYEAYLAKAAKDFDKFKFEEKFNLYDRKLYPLAKEIYVLGMRKALFDTGTYDSK